MNSSKKFLFYMLLIFALGLATGGVIGVTVAKRQMLKPVNLQAIGNQVKKELTHKLELDEAQQKQVGPLVDDGIDRVRVVYFDTLKKIDVVLTDEQEKLVRMLRPEQAAKLSTLARSREEFIQKHNPMEPQK